MRVLWWTYGQTSSQGKRFAVKRCNYAGKRRCKMLNDAAFGISKLFMCWYDRWYLFQKLLSLLNIKSFRAPPFKHHLPSCRVQLQLICISFTFFIFNCMVAPSSKTPRCVIEILEHRDLSTAVHIYSATIPWGCKQAYLGHKCTRCSNDWCITHNVMTVIIRRYSAKEQ